MFNYNRDIHRQIYITHGFNIVTDFSHQFVDGTVSVGEVGAPEVGCCTHAAAVLWYLAYNRYLKEKSSHKVTYSDCIQDAARSQWSNKIIAKTQINHFYYFN